jgi:hypothetical protein
MPGEPKPKQFIAARAVTVAGRSYSVGEPVDDPRVLASLLRFGDKFVAVKRSKSASAETPTAESEEG